MYHQYFKQLSQEAENDIQVTKFKLVEEIKQ